MVTGVVSFGGIVLSTVIHMAHNSPFLRTVQWFRCVHGVVQLGSRNRFYYVLVTPRHCAGHHLQRPLFP